MSKTRACAGRLAPLFAAAVCVLATSSAHAQWEIVTDTIPAQINAVDFFDDQFGIAVGSGVIFKTENGGLTWEVSDTTSFDGIVFNGVTIDETIVGPVAVAVGSNLNVVRSANRGGSWRSVHVGSNAQLIGTCGLGDDRFVAFGIGGWLAESSDTGLTWDARLIFPAADMFGSSCLPSGPIFVAGYANNGSINQCCGVLLRSEDQGGSWTKVAELDDPRQGHYAAVEFVSEQIGYAVGRTVGIRPRSIVWKTIDAGETWESQGAFPPITAIDFWNEDVGAMVGLEGVIYWTEDGGETWVQHPSPTSFNLQDVYLLDEMTAIAVGGLFILRNTTGALVGTEDDELPPASLRHVAYPNPASDRITVTFDGSQRNAEVRIVDVLGREVKRAGDKATGSVTLPVRDLPKGLYFYTIETDDRSGSGSFVVVR